MASSVTSTTRSMCVCAIGNISSPTRFGASESAATLPVGASTGLPAFSASVRVGAPSGSTAIDASLRFVPCGDAADQPAAADRDQHRVELRCLLLRQFERECALSRIIVST